MQTVSLQRVTARFVSLVLENDDLTAYAEQLQEQIVEKDAKIEELEARLADAEGMGTDEPGPRQTRKRATTGKPSAS